ncbi:MAG TPA: DUF1614 domain-containing protein [Thermoplasmatales archaeon]|nr:DUF1614 domain-containing protein [Thermoplasmatales archaeon]
MLIEIMLFILFPFLLLVALFLFFFFYRETFWEIGFGKREMGLLIVGSASTMFFDLPVFFYKNYFLAFNIGGALIPIVLSFYFIRKNEINFLKLLIGVSLVSLTTYMVTIVTERGVISYFPFYFLPPILSILISFLLFFRSPKVCSFSYTVSTLSVIIGGDFSHLPELFEKPFIGSMGGAGVYDMVYIAGLISFVFSFPFIIKKRVSKEERKRNRIMREIYCAGKIAGVEGNYKFIVKKLTGKELDNIEDLKVNEFIKEINKPISKYYANPAKRIASFLIDFLITSAISSIPFFVFPMKFYVFISIFLLIQILYFTLLEFYFGSTVGKAILDIEVRSIENEKVDFMTSFTRNIMRILEFFAIFYLLSLILIIISPKRQRIGDLIADSIVVESK